MNALIERHMDDKKVVLQMAAVVRDCEILFSIIKDRVHSLSSGKAFN